MSIIDFHAHIYPSKIAKKATQSISDFYNIPMFAIEGMMSSLLKSGAQIGASHYVVHGVATVPQQTGRVNDFLVETIKGHDNVFAYGALHPQTENIEDEVNRLIGLGFKGIKLHPDFQEFAIDSKESLLMLEKIEGRLPLLMHAGDCRYNYSNPRQIANLLKALPKLTVIAAHFGGYSVWEDAIKYLSELNIYVDSSSSLPFIPIEKARELINIFTPDRVLFGTDFPMWGHKDELERFKQVVTDQNEFDKITFKNAQALLGI